MKHSCRRADNHLNIFEGVRRNPWFFFVQAVTLGGQIAIVFVGGEAFQTARLPPAMWGWSMLFGLVTLPLGVLLRLLPDWVPAAAWRALTGGVRMLLGLRKQRLRDHDEEEARRARGRGTSWHRRILTRMGIKRRQVQQEELSAVDDAEGGVEGESDNNAAGTFDLEAAIDAARYGTSDPAAGFEVHPDTLKEDPVLDLGVRPESVPPSQDPCLGRYMGL